jgi:uncharacterized protein (TIGR02646 family)
MIRINKGDAPGEGAERRQLLTQQMREAFVQMASHYDKCATDPDVDWVLEKTRLVKHLIDSGCETRIAKNIYFGRSLVPIPGTADFEKRRMIGFGSDTFDSNVYGSPEIKLRLLQSQDGKCAYCESRVSHIDYGDVEHFRPKAGYNQEHNYPSPQYRDAYFWLAYDWSNLYLACGICNQQFKENRFPTVGNLHFTAEGTVAKETTALIDPGGEDPRNFIRFDPITAMAYPWDVIGPLVAQRPEEAQAFIWTRPAVIQEKMKEAYGDSRGAATIALLGLNRSSLVRARAEHLRHLRALTWTNWTEASGHPDGKGALAALDSIRSGGDGYSPTYLSASWDALATWATEKPALDQQVANRAPNTFGQLVGDPWIERYNKIIHSKPSYETMGSLEIRDCPMMYRLHRVDHDYSKSINLIYMTEKEDIDDLDQSGAGWFAAIEDQDMGNRVVVLTSKGAKAESESHTLGDFLQINNVYHKFRRGKSVWVEGDYSRYLPIVQQL